MKNCKVTYGTRTFVVDRWPLDVVHRRATVLLSMENQFSYWPKSTEDEYTHKTTVCEFERNTFIMAIGCALCGSQLMGMQRRVCVCARAVHPNGSSRCPVGIALQTRKCNVHKQRTSNLTVGVGRTACNSKLIEKPCTNPE